MITVLQVDDNSHVQVLVSSGEREGASCHAVAHPGVLCQGFTQVPSGFWMLNPKSGKYPESPLSGSSTTQSCNLLCDKNGFQLSAATTLRPSPTHPILSPSVSKSGDLCGIVRTVLSSPVSSSSKSEVLRKSKLSRALSTVRLRLDDRLL